MSTTHPMCDHLVRTRPSADRLAREEQLAWAIAELAAEQVPVADDVAEMVVNRVIDNAAVAAAAVARGPVVVARAQARAHPAAQVALVRAICLHEHKIDHIAHLGPRPRRGSAICSACPPRRSSRRSDRHCT